MSLTPMDPHRARLVIEARLGRPPQDMLEAAVVLEAWSGVRAERALATARSLMAGRRPRAPERSVGRLPRPSSHEGILLEGIAFIVTVVAIAGWVGPLRSSLGATNVETGLIVALPLTLALQWALRSRYLARPHGLTQLAAVRWRLLGAVGVVVGAASAVLGVVGLLAALLAVIWAGGSILIRGRRPAAYVLTVLGATAGMLAGAAPLAVLVAAALAIIATVGWVLRAVAAPARQSSVPWTRALHAGAVGCVLGLMLVLDRTVSWTEGAIPALFLLPSAVASFWGGYHLRHLGQAIPAAVSGIPASRPAPGGADAWRPVSVLAGAVGRLALVAGALSSVLLMVPWVGADAGSAGVLAGFALLALATLLVGLLDAIGRGRWALIAVACAALAEELVALGVDHPAPGTGLIVGGALGIALMLPVAVAMLSRPAGTLATALWIP
jgi:hypothetical protein